METKRIVAAIGLSTGAVLFGPSQPEVTHYPKQVQAQNYELPPAFVPDYGFGDGELAARHVAEAPSPATLPVPSTAPPETKVLSSPPPTATERTSKVVAEQQKLQIKKRQYVQNVLLPIIRKGTDFKVITVPPGTRDPINAPGQFIVQRSGSCAVQYYVNLGFDTIAPTVWGARKFFRPRAFEDAISNHNSRRSAGLIHIEGTGGQVFSENRPGQALNYIARTYPRLCRIANIPARH
ncbi:MAG TPA: hypothetical protein VLG13_03020 [Patescibacteria group bacterium]|nr:hypothetical protein [Patescibacteria group bacterium]